MIHPNNPTALRVKRDGPRGWHWILAENYDPAVHELVDGVSAPAPAPVQQVTAPVPAPKPKRARKAKP